MAEKTRKHGFTRGTYYIGDPCYAINYDNWDKLIKETNCFGSEHYEGGKNWEDGVFIFHGKKCFTAGTAYGDGLYSDSKRKYKFGVDAGLIGIMPIDAMDKEGEGAFPLEEFKRRSTLGAIVDFDEDFLVWADDGCFHFGDIEIDTNEWCWTDEDEDEDYNA